MARAAAAIESGRLGAASDLAVTRGYGETCPYVPGVRYVDWPLDDPKGQDDAIVRRIVADTDTRVRDLLVELVPGIEFPPPLVRRRQSRLNASTRTPVGR